MAVSYNGLWKLLIDKKMNRTEMKEKSRISTASLAKLGKNANITTDVLVKICNALDCDFSDIMEMVEGDEIEEANEEVTVTESNIDESAETFRYRINYERIIQSGQNAILGDRTLVYSINGGEEKEEKMHKDMCEGDLYKWFCDVEVQKGDVVEYKVVTTYDDGTNSFLMEEGNGTVTVDKAEN